MARCTMFLQHQVIRCNSFNGLLGKHLEQTENKQNFKQTFNQMQMMGLILHLIAMFSGVFLQ